MQASTSIEYIADRGYLRVRQQGQLTQDHLEPTQLEVQSRYSAQQTCKIFLDYRQANISTINVLQLDDLAQAFQHNLPDCQSVALVYDPDNANIDAAKHVKHVLLIRGINAEIFDDCDAADQWLRLQP